MQAGQKKIIVVGPGYPYRNGQSVYVSSLCKELSSEYNVELINYSFLYPKFLFPGSTQYDVSKDRKVSFPNKRLFHSLNPLAWLRTAQYIKSKNPDIIAIDWWHPFFGICCRGLTFLLPKSLKKKVVFITENVISHEANKADKLLTRLGLKDAQCFLALSDAVEKQLLSMFPQKVFRSALPIYDFYQSEEKGISEKNHRSKFYFSEKNTVFLFFGLVRKYKGLDLLLEAFSEFSKKYPDGRLLVVGEFYEPAQPYLDLIKKFNLQDFVHLENQYIPDEKVADYFNACDCVALPYRSATQSGILSVAYGFRKPVIVTDVGELSALVDEPKTGIVAGFPNKENIQRALEKFRELKEKQMPFGNQIFQYLQSKDEFKKVNRVFQVMLHFLHAAEMADR